jgi:hypothetical protein
MAQVKAPEGLWGRIQAEQKARKAAPRTGWILWPLIATVLLVASGDLLWQSVNAASGRFPRPAERTVSQGWGANRTVPAALITVSCRQCHLEPGL